MTKRCSILILASFLLLSSPALTYEADVGHVPLATQSLSLYHSCFPTSTVYQGSDAQNRLVQGNRGMDTGTLDMIHHLNLSEQDDVQLKGRSVFNLAKRITNWHFYNPDHAAHSRIGLVEQSHIRLWRDLKAGLVSNKGMNRLIFLGGLMHLTEDVSVPAHAILSITVRRRSRNLDPCIFDRPWTTCVRQEGFKGG